MAQPRTEHRGHEIVYDDDTDKWKCNALALEDERLSALKKAIDKADKQRRRVNVPALYMTEGWRDEFPKVKSCHIVLLRGDDRKADIKIDGQRGQYQVDIASLYPRDDKAELDRYVEAKKAANKASKIVDNLWQKLEAFDAPAIREIVARMADEES